MPKIIREKSTRKTVYRQESEFESGKGIENACIIYGFKSEDLEEIELTQEEYDADLQAESKPKIDIMNAKKIITNKYKNKKKSEISDADALEFMKLKMAQELGLEI